MVGKPVTTPKAPARSKTASYVSPRLAGSPNIGISPNLRKEQGDATNGVSKVAAVEDISTPVKNFLSSNVTPRSNSRKARVDSASSTPKSTPNGTPTSSRPASMITTREHGNDSSEIRGLGLTNDTRARQEFSESTLSYRENPNLVRKGVSPELHDQHNGPESPMFFYANDASSAPRQTSQESATLRTGFIYADGRQEALAMPKTIPQPTNQSKFCHINGAPESPQMPVGSPTLTSPILAQRQVQQNSSRTESFNPSHIRQRSSSPLKEFEVPVEQATQNIRRSSGISNLSLRTSGTKATIPSHHPKVTSTKEPVFKTSHVKTQSLSSLPRQAPEANPSQNAHSLSIAHSPRSLPETTELPSPLTDQSHAMSPTSPLVSPTHQRSVAGEGRIDQLNELAANARRERKVLDLEISNSSLLAINRTLEREMRKQKSELRRYRRLTSSGRLSINPRDRSISASTAYSVSTGIDSEAEDGLEDDIAIDILTEEEDLDESSTSSPSLSPDARAVRDGRQCARDEKRLRLDLNKHRELLIDSQKMNQSLKRCLGWTEELIFEGRKALAYQVRVSDVSIGGRVLQADDETANSEAEPRKALLSPTRIYADDLKHFPWSNSVQEKNVLPELSHDMT